MLQFCPCAAGRGKARSLIAMHRGPSFCSHSSRARQTRSASTSFWCAPATSPARRGIYNYCSRQRSMNKIIALCARRWTALARSFTARILPRELWSRAAAGPPWATTCSAQGPQGADLCLGMTHEEIIRRLRGMNCAATSSCADLYQIQTKFRDEPRPKSGCCACASSHEDSYSFDIDKQAWTRASSCTMRFTARFHPLRPKIRSRRG